MTQTTTTPLSRRRARRLRQLCTAALAALSLLPALLLAGCARGGGDSSAPAASSAVSATAASTGTSAASTTAVTTVPEPPTAQTTRRTTAATAAVTVSPPTARREVTVTVPEGYSFMQIALLLEQKGVCTVEAFTRVCQSYTPRSFTIPLSDDRAFRMEGYLFPDTYRFYVDDDPESVLIRMLNNFRDRVGEVSDDTLILASILEREARSDKHLRLVSSVFHNRLNHPAEYPYLDADPTRDYVNRDITGNPLLSSTVRFAALYNTCGKRTGLPAGPICSPGLRAIEAARHPADTADYYFFFGKDNENHYSETLEEHERQMALYGVNTGE